MKNIQTLKNKFRAYPRVDECVEAIGEIEFNIIKLINSWNELPDELRYDDRLKGIAEVVRDIE
jgi:hypothetical protein